MLTEQDLISYEKVITYKKNLEEIEKNKLISNITNKIISDGKDCTSWCGDFYFKYSIKPFNLSYRFTIGEGSYGVVEDYTEPIVVGLRCEKKNGEIVTRYIAYVPYGSESYNISTMKLDELKTLYNNM